MRQRKEILKSVRPGGILGKGSESLFTRSSTVLEGVKHFRTIVSKFLHQIPDAHRIRLPCCCIKFCVHNHDTFANGRAEHHPIPEVHHFKPAPSLMTLTFAVGQRNIMNDNAEREVFYGRRSEKLTSHTRDHEGN